MANTNKDANQSVQPTASNSVRAVKDNTKKSAPKKETKPRKSLGKMFKEILSELKKVSWPTFPKVVKQTGVVITVVVVFTLILFGFDRLFSLLYQLLINNIS